MYWGGWRDAIDNIDAEPFEIGIYASVDGVTPGELLMTKQVTDQTDLTVGPHPGFQFPATFTDVPYDYRLMAVVDYTNAIDEVDESYEDNTALFSGGIIKTDDDGQNQYTVIIYGADEASSEEQDFAGAFMTASMFYAYLNSNPLLVVSEAEVEAVHIRTHEGDDEVNQELSPEWIVSVPLWIFGGPGNDEIDGANAADLIYGGDDDDTIDAGLGDDYVYGQNGDDILTGGDGANGLYGGNGDDTLTGGADDDTLYGGVLPQRI